MEAVRDFSRRLQFHPIQLIIFFISVSPLFLSFFFLTISIFNQDPKGFVYLGGVLISSFVWLMLSFMINPQGPPDEQGPPDHQVDPAHEACSILNWNALNNQSKKSPNYSSFYIAFTCAYILSPMVVNNQINWLVVIFLLLFFVADAYLNIRYECTGAIGVMLGSLTGLCLGVSWFTLFYSTGNSDLLYFQELSSNNVVCKRPEKQTFKCAVYKKGELISSNIV